MTGRAGRPGSSVGWLEEFSGSAGHLVVWYIFDVLAEHPLLPERVTQPAGALAVELIRQRMYHLGAGGDGTLPCRVDVGPVGGHDRGDHVAERCW